MWTKTRNMPSAENESDGPPMPGRARTRSSSPAVPLCATSQLTMPSRARISFQE